MIDTLVSNISVTNVLVIVVSLLVWGWYKSSVRPTGFPPGPVAVPLLGNVFQLKDGIAHEVFNEMSKIYGDVFSVKMGPNWCVVLNSLDAARDALLKKPVTFAGRPKTFSIELFSKGYKDIMFSSFSETWKIHRKIGHSAIRHYASGQNLDKLVHKVLPKLAHVLDHKEGQPFEPKAVIAVAVYNIVATLCFGHEYSLHDPKLQKWIRLNKESNAEIGNGLPADILPILKHVPDARTKRYMKLCADFNTEIQHEMDAHRVAYDSESTRDVIDLLFKHQQEAIEDGSAKKESLTDDHLSSTLVDIFAAGTDTTTSTLHWAIGLMAKYPEIQERVAKEVDDVIGRDRPPSIEDHGKLPYSEAVLYEVLRYSSTIPMTVMHTTIEDATLGEYNIPKGTWVTTNIWAIHHSEKHWDDPFKFNPDNFLDKSGEVRQHPEGFLPFSFGRRVCLGEAFAKAEILLLFTWLFQHYIFSPPSNIVGEFGIEIDTSSSIINQPVGFDVIVKRRF